MNNQNRIVHRGEVLEPTNYLEFNPDPNHAPRELIQEIICRRLINLPLSEKTQPRIMINLTEAWWFYKDKYCTVKVLDKDDEKFRKAFFRRIAEEWSFLKPDIQNLKGLDDECWSNYTSRIPRYGTIIFNTQLDKVLFCVFNKQKSNSLHRNVVFPKGKVDEGEDPLEAALRETFEETYLKIRDD